MDDMDFEKLFYYNILAMRITFSHPEIPRDKKWLIKFFFIHVLFVAFAILMMHNICFVYTKTMNFSRLCTNGLYVSLFVEISAQCAIMGYFQGTLNKLIAIMKADYVASKMLEDEHRIVLKWAKKGKSITDQWAILLTCGCIVYALKVIYLTIYYSYTDEFRFIKILDIDYPDFVERNIDNGFVYLFIVIIPQAQCAIYTSLLYMAFVPLGPLFMLHACGQLELVRHRIGTLYNGCPREEVNERLNAVAKQMQLIYAFADDINSCFRVIYELTMKGSAVILPLTTYEVIQAAHRGVLLAELLTFIVGAVSICSTPCYCSDLLIEECNKMCLSLYTCGWERDFNRSVRSSLLIIMIRARRPTAVRTMFRTICLEALTDLFHLAYAIYNLMNAMWN